MSIHCRVNADADKFLVLLSSVLLFTVDYVKLTWIGYKSFLAPIILNARLHDRVESRALIVVCRVNYYSLMVLKC
jgi:hypothetical protein